MSKVNIKLALNGLWKREETDWMKKLHKKVTFVCICYYHFFVLGVEDMKKEDEQSCVIVSFFLLLEIASGIKKVTIPFGIKNV